MQHAAAARELELQTEFEGLSNEMMERIEQLQEEVAGLLEFKQHKVGGVVCGGGAAVFGCRLASRLTPRFRHAADAPSEALPP